MSERIVEVIWEDSNSLEGWAAKSDIKDLKPALIRTVGYVDEDSPAMLKVIADIPVDDDRLCKGRIVAIPRSAIRKVTELKRGRRN